VFVVTSLNRDFSVNRLERYLLLARSGGAEPVVVLSKSDLTLVEDPGYVAERIDEIRDALPEVQVIVTSSVSRYGLERILQLLRENKTGVLVGSSGVGKSTLVNTLLSREALKTKAIREMDDKGRHTTSNSGLFFLESGGIIIDTPGLREVQILGDSNELSGMMPSVAELIALCRFTDCTHTKEPGCAIQQALSNGTIGEKEFANFTKLQRELAASRRKLDVRLQIAERNKWKQIAMDNRRRKNER
jgi:ribosome biogenesis GTPase